MSFNLPTIPKDIMCFVIGLLKAENTKYEEYDYEIEECDEEEYSDEELDEREDWTYIRYNICLSKIRGIYNCGFSFSIVRTVDTHDDIDLIYIWEKDNKENSIEDFNYLEEGVAGLLLITALIRIYEKNSMISAKIDGRILRYIVEKYKDKDEDEDIESEFISIGELKEKLKYYTTECGKNSIVLEKVAGYEYYILKYK